MPINGETTSNKRKKYRDYTQAEREYAVAIAELHSNNGAAQDITGIPHETIRYWRNNGVVSTAQVQVAQGDLAKELDILAWELVGLSRDKFQDASLSQVAHAISVAIDKSQLLKGAPTSIPGKTVTAEEARSKLRELLLSRVQEDATDVQPTSLLVEEQGVEGVQEDGTPEAETVGKEQSEVTSPEIE
jgi:hypothetical protein